MVGDASERSLLVLRFRSDTVCACKFTVPFYVFELLVGDGGAADGLLSLEKKPIAGGLAGSMPALDATANGAGALGPEGRASSASSLLSAGGPRPTGPERHRSATHAQVDGWAATQLRAQALAGCRAGRAAHLRPSHGAGAGGGDPREGGSSGESAAGDQTQGSESEESARETLESVKRGLLAQQYEVPPLFRDVCAMCVPRALREASTDGVFLVGPKRSGWVRGFSWVVLTR
jgi:hypothetical protein